MNPPPGQKSQQKCCSHCKHLLPLDMFSPRANNADDLTNVCDPCRESVNYRRARDKTAQLPDTDPARWQKLASDLIQWYYDGASFETIGERLRDRARKLIR